MAKSKRRKARRNVTVGIAHIKATFNNTTVTITDTKGDTLVLGQRRHQRLQGKPQEHALRRPVAAQQAAEKASKFGVKEVDVQVKGPGSGRESAITALAGRRPDDQVDRRRHAAAAQRLPPAEEAPRVS